MKKYKLTKNEFIDVEGDYLCGKCDTLFGNIYEYVLHSISVCNNKRTKYSSHFVLQQLYKSPSEVEWPLDIIFAENFSFNSWSRKQSKNLDHEKKEKVTKTEPM